MCVTVVGGGVRFTVSVTTFGRGEEIGRFFGHR